MISNKKTRHVEYGVWLKLTDDIYPYFDEPCILQPIKGDWVRGMLYERSERKNRVSYAFTVPEYYAASRFTHFMLIPNLNLTKDPDNSASV